LIILDGSLITPDTCNVLRDDGIVILNTARPEKYQFIKQKLVTVDATKIALDILKRPLTNVAMLGAFAGATGSVDLDTIEKTLKESFSPALFEKNKQVLHEAYNQVKGVD